MADLAVHRKVTLVAATSTLLSGKNPARQYLLVVNDGATDIYLGLSSPAVQSAGIRVNNGGGSYEINFDNPFTGEVNAISSGTPDVLVTEF